MRKALTKSQALYHLNDGNKVDGANPLMSGDCSGLRGDCSELRGDCSGLRGDLDDCDLTADERAVGFSVADLVGP